MPKTDYTKTIIYKIINHEYPELIYVGSTTNFKSRKSQHKSKCNNPKSDKYHLKLYQNIRENGGWDSWNMIQICEYPCSNKREAECEEDKYLVELKAVLNTNRAFCTKERREIMRNISIQKRNDNMGPEAIKAYRRKKDAERADKKKEYYIQERSCLLKERVDCVCGANVCKGALTRHKKSAFHKNYMSL